MPIYVFLDVCVGGGVGGVVWKYINHTISVMFYMEFMLL